ncbi:hypothetical protein HDU80_009027 [Chytriomyces hyalinus]|nr:hypothetical protein HDU80_009027 [Chytriomyces hyalinus]
MLSTSRVRRSGSSVGSGGEGEEPQQQQHQHQHSQLPPPLQTTHHSHLQHHNIQQQLQQQLDASFEYSSAAAAPHPMNPSVNSLQNMAMSLNMGMSMDMEIHMQNMLSLSYPSMSSSTSAQDYPASMYALSRSHSMGHLHDTDDQEDPDWDSPNEFARRDLIDPDASMHPYNDRKARRRPSVSSITKRVKRGSEGGGDSKDPKFCLSDQISYADLITYAIAQTDDKRLKLQSIYTFLTSTFGYFRHNPAKRGWENSIRHNLSMKSKCRFRKIKEEEDSEKGCYWSLNPTQPFHSDSIDNAWDTAEKLEFWQGVLYYKLSPAQSAPGAPPLFPVLFSEDDRRFYPDMYTFDESGNFGKFKPNSAEPAGSAARNAAMFGQGSRFGAGFMRGVLPIPTPPYRNIMVQAPGEVLGVPPKSEKPASGSNGNGQPKKAPGASKKASKLAAAAVAAPSLASSVPLPANNAEEASRPRASADAETGDLTGPSLLRRRSDASSTTLGGLAGAWPTSSDDSEGHHDDDDDEEEDDDDDEFRGQPSARVPSWRHKSSHHESTLGREYEHDDKKQSRPRDQPNCSKENSGRNHSLGRDSDMYGTDSMMATDAPLHGDSSPARQRYRPENGNWIQFVYDSQMAASSFRGKDLHEQFSRMKGSYSHPSSLYHRSSSCMMNVEQDGREYGGDDSQQYLFDLFNDGGNDASSEEASLLFGDMEQHQGCGGLAPLINVSSLDIERLIADPTVATAGDAGSHGFQYFV